MSIEWIIVLAIVIAIVAFVILLYNRLVTLRQRVREAWSDIDVQLKRRHDLIPNLVATVQGYAAHEKGVFENVTKARAAAISAGQTGTPQERAVAENQLTAALRTVFAVAANRWRTVALVTVFTGLLVALGYVVGEVFAPGGGVAMVPLALGFSGVSATASYFAGDKLVLAQSQARELAPGAEPQLRNIVETLSIGLGTAPPRIYLIDDTAPNAFATGRDPKHASIVVTRGLLDKLDRTELEGVIAHEMSHVVNRDIRVMLLVTVLVGTVALLSDWMLRSFAWGGGGRRGRDRGGGGIILIIAVALAILTPIVATLIQLA